MLESFDAEGFCELLGIRHSDYLANATYLRERGYVADTKLQKVTIEHGGIFITVAGVEFLEQIQL
jgi:hypothetical protein